jgi:hypothetical protein
VDLKDDLTVSLLQGRLVELNLPIERRSVIGDLGIAVLVEEVSDMETSSAVLLMAGPQSDLGLGRAV